MGIKILWLLITWLCVAKAEVEGNGLYEMCVDVSTYGDLKFGPTAIEKCDTEFVKNCEERSEEVCDEVTETKCEIVPYTKCEMTMEPTTYKSFEMNEKIFEKKVCTDGMDVVKHKKMLPECQNVTKQNCVTKWVYDDNKQPIWAGNEDCEPVTWRECQLVEKLVDFKVPTVNCTTGEEIPYMTCEEIEKEAMINKMTCEVLHTIDCRPTTSKKCQTINFRECFEEPQEDCKMVTMKVPMQEKEHKKKCLLPADGSLANLPKPVVDEQEFAPRSSKALTSNSAGGEFSGALRNSKSITNLAAIVAQENGEESRRSFARPLPLSQNFNRQGRVFQQVQQRQQQRRPFNNVQQGQFQFVRGGGN